jgi:hypothetical protein
MFFPKNDSVGDKEEKDERERESGAERGTWP